VYREVRTRIARINAFLQEHITGMATVQLFTEESRSFERFDRLNAEHRQANLEAIFYYAVFFPAVELVSALGIALLIWYGGGQVLAGEVTLGALIGFVQLSQRFFQPISDLSEKYNILQSAMAASERIFALLDTPIAIVRREGYRPERVRGHIEFRHVWFAYEGEDWVLRDVSFEVHPGETVALVGPTGAGKTTIAHLLLRFYDVHRGEVLVDGVDVRQWDLSALRRAFALVPQDVFLFSGDVMTNIRLGERDFSEERVREAARRVHAHAVIERLPHGYQTEVGERGALLSAGEKQLIAFARALCFDPPILILDEATAHIDPQTEGLIREALETLLAGRTSVIIAHRLSTVQRADRIIVLHKGRVREIGTHAELLERDGLYARLYRLQYRRWTGSSTAEERGDVPEALPSAVTTERRAPS
jgi:ABC-type multidrug transport system fused ATPase/permease subunit